MLNTLPPFQLRAQNGSMFGSKELAGKVWIANFIFTRCQDTCPAQSAELVKIQAEIAGKPFKDDVRFVSFTVDPAYDNPGVLYEYAKEIGADTSTWAFLTGERDAIWSLSKDGFKLPVSEGGDSGSLVAHSQNFVLVDRARRIRGLYDGLDGAARERMMADLPIVLQDPPGPITFEKAKVLSAEQGPVIYEPPEVKDVPWMKERAAAQERTAPTIEAFHGFRFTDRLPESGITFVNQTVDDTGKHYKGVHYDHGNGVVVADVDGDGLYDLYFVNQLGSNQLARNLGNGRFEDITGKAGVAVNDRICISAAFADTDNDGDPDLYVTSVREGNLLFENDGSGNFRDVTTASGLGYKGHSSSALFFDYDRDGLVDLFLTNVGRYTTDERGDGGYWIGLSDAFSGQLYPERYEKSVLYRNTGNNRFKDVSKEVELLDDGWTGDASPIDLNQDGWPDLYVLSMQGHDQYYENEGGKKFVKKSREIFPRTSWGSMGIKVFDADNDGLMDIFITDMHTDMVDDLYSSRRYWYAEKMKMTESYPERFLHSDLNHVMGNSFFHNEGNGRFREASDEYNLENYWPWGLSVGDLNADGWDDVFITASMNFPFRYGVNSLLLNDGGKKFRDSEFITGVEPRRDGRTEKLWFTLDCDGADKPHPGCRGRRGKLEIHAALGSRSSVIFDLDNDGDLDIVTNEFNDAPMVLVSDLSEKMPGLRYLMVALEGTKSNRSGLGATVRVTAGGRTYTKVHDGLSGYFSHGVYPLYFGLGSASQADKVEVTWPGADGKTQVVAGPIETNRVLTVAEE